MNGWYGRVLRVDLTNQTHTIETVDPQFAKDYIGGRGWAIKYLMDGMDPKEDALSPRKHPHLRHRATHWQPGSHRQSVHGRHQVAPHRRAHQLQLRRRLPHLDETHRLRPLYLRGAG